MLAANHAIIALLDTHSSLLELPVKYRKRVSDVKEEEDKKEEQQSFSRDAVSQVSASVHIQTGFYHWLFIPRF